MNASDRALLRRLGGALTVPLPAAGSQTATASGMIGHSLDAGVALRLFENAVYALTFVENDLFCREEQGTEEPEAAVARAERWQAARTADGWTVSGAAFWADCASVLDIAPEET